MRGMVLDWVRSLFRSKKRLKICLLGPSGAGKTTMLWHMKTGQQIQGDKVTLEDGHEIPIRPTHGMDFENFKFDGWSFTVCDMGGQPVYRQAFWEVAMKQSPDGIVFVIDSTDRARIEDYKAIFKYAMSLMKESAPVLMLANKQDLKDLNPMTEQEVLEKYEINRFLPNHSVRVARCSGKQGEGLKEAFSYIVEMTQRA
jgi:GTPase SAR1 family protein